MPRVDLIKRPAVSGSVPRAAVREFIRAMGISPADVVSFSLDLDRVRVEVVHRNADGKQWATPDMWRVTYDVERWIT